MVAENDEIAIKIKADGAAETAKELDALTASLEKQRKTQEMIAKTAEQIKRNNVIDAIKKEAAEVNNLSAALQRNLAATQQSAAAIGNQTSGLEGLRAKLGPTVALLGTLGTAFSQLMPQASGTIGAIQKVAASMSQVMAFAGSGGSVAGPWGAVAGGIVGLISGIATAMGQAKTEADALAKATAENAKALGDYVEQITRLRGAMSAKISGTQNETDLRTRLLKGQGTEQEYKAEIATQNARLDNPYYSKAYTLTDLRKRAQIGTEADAIRDYVTQLAGQMSEVKGQGYAATSNAADKRTQELVLAGSDVKEGKTPQQAWAEYVNKVKNTKGADNSFAMEQLGGDPNEMSEFSAGVLRDQAPSDKAAAKRVDDAKRWKEMEIRINNETIEAINADREDAAAKDLARMNKRKDDLEKISQQEAAAQMAAVQMVTGASLKGISEVLKGKKLESGAILESLGDQFVAAGTGLIFTGLGLSANPFMPGSGAGMVSIGAAEVGFGLTLGAAGARMPGGSNSGGGGAGSAATGAGTVGAANDPYRNTFTPPGGGGPTIINLNFPTLLTPSAVDGARIEMAMAQARRVYG